MVGSGAACRARQTRRSLVSVLGSPSPGESDAFEAGHPSAGRLEATAFGQLAEGEARAVRAHAAACAICGPVLRRDEVVYQRLVLLRADEPTIHVSQRVLDGLDHEAPHTAARKAVRPAVLALSVVLGALVLTTAGRWRVWRSRWWRRGQGALSGAGAERLRRSRRAGRLLLRNRR